MIDMYRSLLMCTIEFVVRGSLAVLIGAVEMVSPTRTSHGSEVSRLKRGVCVFC